MRLLVVTQVFWPENFRINDLVAELVTRGHDVTVLTGVPNYPEGSVFPEYRADPLRFRKYEGAEIVRVPIAVRGRNNRVRLVLNYLSYALSASALGAWKLKGRSFDIILVYEPSPITVGLPAVFLGAIRRIPVVLWVLDLWPDTLAAIGVIRSPRLLAVVGKLVSFIYRRCDLILAQSRAFVPRIRAHCSSAKRVEYFPNWAEALFTEAHPSRAPEVSPARDTFSIMFAGNIGEAQDFPAILAAAELLRGQERVRWLIVGDGRMLPWVKQEVERRQLAETVILLGRHPVERMPAFFRHADAMLVSLKDEPIFAMTIPGKLQSYLAAGLPVIAMLNGEGADVVERARAGVTCRAGDAHGLAAAARRMLSMSASERATLAENAAAASESEFDRARLISQLERWCQDLLVDRRAMSDAKGGAT